MVASQPCPRCKKILEYYDSLMSDSEKTYYTKLEKYEPYNSWTTTGKGGVTFNNHAFKCPVCDKRWKKIER